jgi:DNA polymerase-3 subunit gamma/tau
MDSPGAANGVLSLPALIDLWPKIRADVKALNRRIEALLQQVDPAGVNGSQVVLVSPYEFHRNRVNSDEVRLVVESVIGRLVNSNVQVACMTREDAQRIVGSRPIPAPTDPVGPSPATPPDPDPMPAEPLVSNGIDKASDVIDADLAADQQRKDEDARIRAAKNIFDAEEVVDEGR